MLESSLLIASLSQAQLHAAVEPLCRRRTEKRAGRGHGRDHQHRQRPRAERRDAATAQAVLAGHQRSDSRPCFWCVLEPLHAKKIRLRRLVNYHYNNLKWGLVITGNYPVMFLLVITAQITVTPIRHSRRGCVTASCEGHWRRCFVVFTILYVVCAHARGRCLGLRR